MSKATVAIYKDVLRTGRGADRATAALANALATRGYTVHIITRQRTQDPFSVTFDPAITCHWVRASRCKACVEFFNKLLLKTSLGAWVLRHMLPFFDLMLRLSRRLHEKVDLIRPDLVIAAGTNEVVELTYAGGFQQPLIQMFHVYPPTCFTKNKYQRVTRLREALQHVSECQVLLPSHCETLKPYTEAPVTAIGNCINFPLDAPLPPAESRKKAIVYVAYFTKDKDQLSLIRAFAQLERADDWELHLYGSGTPDWEQRLKNCVAEHHLEARVRFYGVTKTPYPILLNASICAFPSRVEGFGLSLLEAMWCGLPCVGFKSTPAVNELIVHQKTGLLVEEDTPTAFATALQHLIDNPELRVRLGTAGSTYARETYTPEVIWQKWDALLARHLA